MNIVISTAIGVSAGLALLVLVAWIGTMTVAG